MDTFQRLKRNKIIVLLYILFGYFSARSLNEICASDAGRLGLGVKFVVTYMGIFPYVFLTVESLIMIQKWHKAAASLLFVMSLYR